MESCSRVEVTAQVGVVGGLREFDWPKLGWTFAFGSLACAKSRTRLPLAGHAYRVNGPNHALRVLPCGGQFSKG